MTHEEFQTIVLEKLTGIEKITTDMERIESKVERIGSKVELIESRVELIESKIDKLAAEGQEDVKAMLRHVDKKLDVQNESIDDKFDALNDRLFSHETQLQRLKKMAK